MKINHNFYLNLAFKLAEKNLGKTAKNPSVGCLIVKDNSVISSATTSINGRPHAEFNALNKRTNFKGSNLYVTLEPCTHFGQTPPCTNLINKKKIKKVYYSFNDPDIRTNKKAKKVLKSVIKLQNPKNENFDFYQSYFINQKKKFPLIDAKVAVSKDFFTIRKKSQWITNKRSRKVAHLIRSQYNCIISTAKSINKDNSLLNCRINGFDNHKPDLMIIDRDLKLKKKLKLLNNSNRRKKYKFNQSIDKRKKFFFKKKGVKIIKINNLENRDDFVDLFQKIFKIGYGRILIESGLIFLNKLFNFKLINNLYLFRTDELLGKNGYNNCSVNFIKKLKLKRLMNVNLHNDSLYKIKVR